MFAAAFQETHGASFPLLVAETAAFVLSGLVVLAISWRLIDLLTPGALVEEVFTRGNQGLAAFAAGFMIADALVLRAVMSGSGAEHDAGMIEVGSPFGSMIISTLVWSVIGIALKFGSYSALNLIAQRRFTNCLANGNLAVGILAGGFFVSVGLVIAAALGG